MLADRQYTVERRNAKKLTTKVDIRALKSFALKKLPKDQPLRDIILSEEDELDVNIFLARLPIWIKLQ